MFVNIDRNRNQLLKTPLNAQEIHFMRHDLDSLNKKHLNLNNFRCNVNITIVLSKALHNELN